jgi:class 3 adenylate cyclase
MISSMAELRRKSLAEPDHTIDMPGIRLSMVELGDITVARAVHEPGWRWSTHIKPKVGGDWCQVRHVGVVAAGRLGIILEDGTTYELGPDDVVDIPPGHDGYVIGHEPVVLLEWTGVRAFTGFMGSGPSRVLSTLLLTDVVDSSAVATRLGDAAWRALLSDHFEAVRGMLELFRGREINTTGDGMLTSFQGPNQALGCAVECCRMAGQAGLTLRAGVHVGEVEVVGNDVRGIAVHAVARIAAAAEPGEILVSETTRALAPELSFEDRGVRTLKGLPGEWRLSSFAGSSAPP